jgi:hypothetical protein
MRAMFRPALLLSATLLLLAGQARAVAVATTTGNTTAPGDDPGWLNVGVCNTASAVYLGDRWVLTAYHVNASAANPVGLNGNVYATIPSTGTRLHNNGTGGMTALTDLIMVRLATDPGLPSLNISATAPTLGDDITMIGNGLNREAARTFWQVTMNAGADTWVETGGAHNAEGFKALTTQTMRWGTNDAEGVGLNVDYGVGSVRGFVSLFDDSGALPNEAQAMTYDSGGGVFHKNGAQWDLSGIMLTTGTPGNPSFFDSIPGGAAVFEQSLTFMADLSFYRTQILGIMVPEPGAVALTAASAALLLRRRRA